MTSDQIAKLVEEAFTPLAFTCSCGGAHPDCHTARLDTYTYAQYETVTRIVKFIKALDGHV